MPQVYQPRYAVLGGALDREVLGRRAGRHDLGADAGVARLQRAVLELRPPAAHGGIKFVGAVRVDRVVDAVDPFDIGTELGLAAHVDGDVHAQAARHRDGIDQAREGRASGQGEIISFGVIRRGNAVGWHASDFLCESGGVQAGRVHDQAATQVHRLGPADLDLDAAARDPALLHRAVEGQHGAALLGIALQRQHVGVAVDDPGAGRQQRRGAVEVGFHLPRFAGAQQPHALDAIGLGAALDLGKLAVFDVVGGGDQLAAIAMRHPVLGAVGIEQAAAGNAGARHQAALGIIDAGVDDFGIARAGLGADALGRLQHDDLTAGKGKGAGDGKTHHAGADHDAVDRLERGRIHGRMLVETAVTTPARQPRLWPILRDAALRAAPQDEAFLLPHPEEARSAVSNRAVYSPPLGAA